MHKLLKYSDNFSMTWGSLRNYYRDEVNKSAKEIDNNENMIKNNKTGANKSFKHKTKIIGSTSNSNSRLNADVVVLLKYLINFWKSLDLPLINCEIDLTWHGQKIAQCLKYQKLYISWSKCWSSCVWRGNCNNWSKISIK